MSKPVSKALIGGFVIGALVLVVAALLVFGSGKFFTRGKYGVMIFEGSTKGLNIGSPVVIQGVKIGEVADINLLYDVNAASALVAVVARIYPEKMTLVGYGEEPTLDELIDRGFRAQLQLQSFVTGQLMVNLGLYPDTPKKLYGYDSRYPEVPTVPTTMEELQKTLENLPLEEIITKLDSTIAGLDSIVNSPELKANFRNINKTLNETQAFVKHIDAELVPNIISTSDAARHAVSEIVPNISASLASAQSAMDEVQQTMSEMKGFTSHGANLGYDMSKMFEEITALSRSLRIFADYLQEHPEALIKGKIPPKGE